MESVVYVKKYELCARDDDYSSSNENISGAGTVEPVINEPLPEIEARLSEKNVLIRIHCEKRKGILDKTLAEIEKLEHLSVTNSSVMSFGSSVLDMTIIAEVWYIIYIYIYIIIMHASLLHYIQENILYFMLHKHNIRVMLRIFLM